MGRAKKAVSRTTKKKNSSESTREEVDSSLSLPVISNEKLFSVDNFNIMKTQKDSKMDDETPRGLPPKVKIRCEALDYERIIDFSNNNNIILGKIQKYKKAPEKRSVRAVLGKIVGMKNINNKNFVRNNMKNPVRSVQKTTRKPSQKHIKKSLQENVKKSVQKKSMKNSDETVHTSVKNSKILPHKTSLNDAKKDSLQNCIKKSCTVQHSTTNELNVQTNTFEDPYDQSCVNLNIDPLNLQGESCSPLTLMNDESEFIEFSDINLEVVPVPDNVHDELKMEFGENLSEKNENKEDNFGADILKPIKCVISRDKNHSDLADVNVNALGKISLQSAIETFMKNPHVKYLKGSTALKRGLCFNWLSNNYICSNQKCMYNHNAVNLFTRKLRKYPSKFVMSVVVSMRHDLLFVDVVLAAFKVISERQIPVVWVTFLTFFVFYVTEPSDPSFLKFWGRAARFFCELQKNCSATSGFASLLAIFSHIEPPQQWKVLEFIKLIRQPPVEVLVNFTLLQPVLKMDLPLEFLTAAIETCMANKKDLLKVYWLVLPKIPIMTSPIEIVELMLKFCKMLEEINHKDFAEDLKERLQGKVWSIKTKIARQKYPLTAAFQEELSVYSNEDNPLVPSVSFPEENLDMDMTFMEAEKGYFEPKEDFCDLMAQTMEFSTDAIPKPFKSTVDIGERQITRIKQFFRDCQFDLLGKYLNELKPSMTERAAEEFLKLLFQMKISVQQGVDLLKIVLLPCKSDCAAKVIASISITLVLNLVKINEWEKAYTIVSLCQEKKINLVEGKIFYTGEVTQCRIILLLVEIHGYKENYRTAGDLIKKYSLFSPSSSLWEITWKPQDEAIRVRILEDLLEQVISRQLTEMAYEFFETIRKEQKQLFEPVDLRKFVNRILILLLNQDNMEAINLYEQMKSDDLLNETTIRAIVVTLIRRNRLSDAKTLALSPGQNPYFTPKITSNSVIVKVLSFWLSEEIYIIFDALFDLFIKNKTSINPTDYNNVEIQLEESKPNLTSNDLRPLCLGIISPSLKDACSRIQKVLQSQFNPPLKLIIMPYYLKLDEFSVRLHLQKRIKNLNI